MYALNKTLKKLTYNIQRKGISNLHTHMDQQINLPPKRCFYQLFSRVLRVRKNTIKICFPRQDHIFLILFNITVVPGQKPIVVLEHPVTIGIHISTEISKICHPVDLNI